MASPTAPPDTITAPELLALVRDASTLAQAREALALDVLSARSVGHTWREIARAVGMTEHGVANLHARTAAAQESTEHGVAGVL
jgi:predicted transcriptional regulator